MKTKNTYYVYSLIRNGRPIYVGMTKDLKTREKQHKKNKIFDFLFVIKSYSNKTNALIAENSIIRFISILDNNCIENGTYVNLTIEFEYKKNIYINEAKS